MANRNAYRALHKWMNRHYPRTGQCEECGCTDRPTHYHSIGHTYTRNREDWQELCPKCHRATNPDSAVTRARKAAGARARWKDPDYRHKVIAASVGRCWTEEQRDAVRKTHCINGHAFSRVNTYIYQGKKQCRICRAAAARRNYERRKALAAG